MFNYAINLYNIISVNPVKNIFYKSDISPLEKRALTLSELDDLLKKLSNIKVYEKFYIMSLLAGKCGLRLGEVLGVKWSDIDFKNNILYVNQQWKLLKDGTYGFGPLKTLNSKRSVPISNIVRSELLRYDKDHVRNINNRVIDLVSVNGAGSNIQRAYRDVGYAISIHELRHTYATLLISNGVDFKTAARLLGHTVEMTMRTYSHVTDDMLAKASNIINSIL